MEKKYKALVMFPLVALVLLCWWLVRDNWDGKRDLKMAMLDSSNLWLVTVSPERKMTNVIVIDGRVDVWIPRGLGWYRVEVLKKIVNQESMLDKWQEIPFFNFGFVPDKLELKNNDEPWNGWRSLVNQMGILGYIRYLGVEKQMLTRVVKLKENEVQNEELLDEIMPRDFADYKTLGNNTGLNIINVSDYSGLAGFISKRLEWAGVSVGSVENGSRQVDSCLAETINIDSVGLGLKQMLRIMGCRVEVNNQTGSGEEIDLFLGKSYAEMLKYSGYKRN